MDKAPQQLSMADWIITGREIIAWINDIEFFDIIGDIENGVQAFALRINNAATATSIYLGQSASVEESMGWASHFLGAILRGELLQEEFTCSHGKTFHEGCDDCANS